MSAGDTGASRAVLAAARAILRPLVRQLIARGVTYPAFSRLAKEVYIDVGTRHFTLAFKKQTDSRVALVTGITRKEIGQIRRGQTRRATGAAARGHALAARVIARWLSGPPYTTADGSPYRLGYESAPGVPSFVGLVEEVGGDIPPRAVLDELLRSGQAKLTRRGDVWLPERGAPAARDIAEELALLGSDAEELIAAMARHLDAREDDAFLRHRVVLDDVAATDLPALRRRVQTLSAEFVAALHGLFAEHMPTAPAAADAESPSRSVVALYYFDEPVDRVRSG